MIRQVRNWLARALLPPNVQLIRVHQTKTLERLEDGRWRGTLTVVVTGRDT
jgi:hypothetical protein